MTTYRAYLAYSAAYERPNVWRLADDGAGIGIRFRMASGTEHVRTLTFEELGLRTWDSDTWIATPLHREDWLGKVEFVFRGAPEHIANAIRVMLANAPTDPPPPAAA